MSDSLRPHRWQPTRFCCPWDSPGKNTGVGLPYLSPMHESEKWKWSRSVVSNSSGAQKSKWWLQLLALKCNSPVLILHDTYRKKAKKKCPTDIRNDFLPLISSFNRVPFTFHCSVCLTLYLASTDTQLITHFNPSRLFNISYWRCNQFSQMFVIIIFNLFCSGCWIKSLPL